MMAWMCKGMEIDMRVKVDMRLMVWVYRMKVGMTKVERMKIDMMWMGMICWVLKVDMMRVDMMKMG